MNRFSRRNQPHDVRDQMMSFRASKKEIEQIRRLGDLLGIPMSEVLHRSLSYWVTHDTAVREAIEDRGNSSILDMTGRPRQNADSD